MILCLKRSINWASLATAPGNPRNYRESLKLYGEIPCIYRKPLGVIRNLWNWFASELMLWRTGSEGKERIHEECWRKITFIRSSSETEPFSPSIPYQSLHPFVCQACQMKHWNPRLKAFFIFASWHVFVIGLKHLFLTTPPELWIIPLNYRKSLTSVGNPSNK